MTETLVKDVMTTDVISVSPEMSVFAAIEIFIDKGFNGLPVVDKNNKLVGLLTQYNLIMLDFLMNVPKLGNLVGPTLQTAKDTKEPQKELKVGDVMEKEPITLLYDDSYERALELMNKHHRINPIPVIDNDKNLKGIVSRYDLLRLIKLFGHT